MVASTTDAPVLTKQQKRDVKRKRKLDESNGHGQSSTSSSVNNKQRKVEKVEGSSVYKRAVCIPVTYNDYNGPKDRFLCPNDGDTFVSVMKCSYPEFYVDAPDAYNDKFHCKFKKSFDQMDKMNRFQYDYTQPLGLNSKVVKTLVSRCLVGIPGITYKYLGIRMFSYPWTDKYTNGITAGDAAVAAGNVDTTDESKADDAADDTNVFTNIGTLNDIMIRRTKRLLKETGNQDTDTNNKSVIEPTFQKDTISVNWHADSSLEHYSSIGVYHLVLDADNDTHFNCNKANVSTDWKIALKCCPFSEGPSQKIKQNAESSSEIAPPVAIPLPSRSTYYLLDEFNHHHQHSVLRGSNERFASTHRVSRIDSHTFSSIKTKCSSAIQEAISGSFKYIRRIQLVLTELEFEWIRQYYVQGSLHHKLHVWWHEPMKELLGYYGALQALTVTQFKILKDAGGDIEKDTAAINKLPKEEQGKEKKKMQKRAKRIAGTTVHSYDELLEQLADRQTKRSGWINRYKELGSLAPELKPLSVPLPTAKVFVSIDAMIAQLNVARQAFIALHPQE